MIRKLELELTDEELDILFQMMGTMRGEMTYNATKAGYEGKDATEFLRKINLINSVANKFLFARPFTRKGGK